MERDAIAALGLAEFTVYGEAVGDYPGDTSAARVIEQLRAQGFDVVRTEPATHPAGHAVEAMQRTVDTETARLEEQAGR